MVTGLLHNVNFDFLHLEFINVILDVLSDLRNPEPSPMRPLKFNPRQIEAFRLVMLHGSVTLAAQNLFVSQPAVSRLIRDLEQRFGLLLFERRGNQLVPTPEAAILLSEIERTLVGLNSIERCAADLRERKTGALRVVALPAMAMGFIPRLIGRFIADRQLSTVHVHGMPSHLVVEAVSTGQVDIGFAAQPPDRPGLIIEPLVARAVVILPAKHRLARRPVIHPKDLSGENFIRLAGGLSFDIEISRILKDVHINVVVTTPLSGIACSLVAAGTGVSIVDPFSASDFAGDNLIVKRLEPAPEIRIAVVTSEVRRLSRIGEAFMDLVRAETQALSEREPGRMSKSASAPQRRQRDRARPVA